MKQQRWYNPLVKALLHSPFRRALGDTLLITVTGRKSHSHYTTPVCYLRAGDTLLILTSADRAWWKNLRGGAPVTVDMEGNHFAGMGESFTETSTVAEGLLLFLRSSQRYQKAFHVSLDQEKQPDDPAALKQATVNVVLIRVSNLSVQEISYEHAKGA